MEFKRVTQCVLAALCMWGHPQATAQNSPRVIQYTGICDASAAVALNKDLFAVADDEDNILRVYRREEGGPPVYSLDLSSFLLLGKKAPETDLEASAPLGDLVFWVTSHGRNSKAKDQPSRQRLFATRASIAGTNVQIKPVGIPYTRLLRDLIAEPKLKSYDLAGASRKAPKSPGALNIEGLAATPEGQLLIGFRNPIPARQALLVPLLNPMEVIEGRAARLGDPILLDLDGLGIRSIASGHAGYLIVAGSFDGGGESRLYQWDGRNGSKPQWLREVKFAGLNPEALAFDEGGRRVEILSDDGTVSINGTECKRLKDWRQKHFRAVWVTVGEKK